MNRTPFGEVTGLPDLQPNTISWCPCWLPRLCLIDLMSYRGRHRPGRAGPDYWGPCPARLKARRSLKSRPNERIRRLYHEVCGQQKEGEVWIKRPTNKTPCLRSRLYHYTYVILLDEPHAPNHFGSFWNINSERFTAEQFQRLINLPDKPIEVIDSKLAGPDPAPAHLL